MSRRVVITGRAIASPLGYTITDNQQGWWGKRSNFAVLDAPTLSAKYAVGMCPPPDVSQLPDRKVQKVIIRKDLIGLLTVLGASRDAAYKQGDVNPDRFGIYVGSGSTQVSDLKPYVPLIEKSTSASGAFSGAEFGKNLQGSVNPMVMLQNLMNNTLCYSSIALDARGVNANFMDFQTAGIRSVIEGYHSIVHDRADFIIAGGVACTPDPPTLREGQKLNYLTSLDQTDADLSKLVKPFDAAARGTILSESSAFLVLEEEEHAIKRGATIYGRILSCNITGDGRLSFDAKGDAANFAKCLAKCAEKISTPVSGLSAIVGHASGAPGMDHIEMRGYQQLLQGARVPIQSSKGYLGDLSEASGVASILVALDSLAQKVLPPTVNFSQLPAGVSGLQISNQPQTISSKQIMVTTRSFGGINAAVIISEP